MITIDQLKKDVISACRILSHQKLVEGFGHVSARIPDSDRFSMTPRVGLALREKGELFTMNLNGMRSWREDQPAIRNLVAYCYHESRSRG